MALPTRPTGSPSVEALNYQTKYTYFYIPKTNTDLTATTDDKGLGTFLRLGGYSDQEETQKADQNSFYPKKFIDDEKAASKTNIFETAAGPNPATSHGILLACDGRILVKAGEKMYVESGPFHQKTNGTHTLEASGETVIKSTGGKISIVSGTGKDILLDAGGDSKGDFQLIAQKSTSDIKGDDSTTRHGNTYSLHHGRTDSFFLGGKSAFSLAGSFALTTGIDLTIKVGFFFGVYIAGSFTVSAMSMSVTGASFSTTHTNMEMDSLTFKTGNVAVETAAAKAHQTAVISAMAQVECNTGNIKTTAETINSNNRILESCINQMSSEIGMKSHL